MNQADIIRARFVTINSDANKIGKYAEPSKLRIEHLIKNGVGTYVFDIKKTDINNQREKSLDRNDIFVPTRWGLLLALRSTTNPSSEVLASFPMIGTSEDVTSVHPVGFLNDNIESLYNGSVTWLVDNGVLLSAYPTESFRKVPRQQGAFVLNSEDAAVNEQIKPEWNLDNALEFITPRLTVAGTRDHKISVNFDAAGLEFAVTDGYEPVLVLYMDGFLIKSGCENLDNNSPFAKQVGQW